MKNVVILGGHGSGMIAASVIDRCKLANLIGFLNDVDEVGSSIGLNKKIPVIGKTNDVKWLVAEDENLYVITGWGGFKKAKETIDKIESLGVPLNRYFNAFDHTAQIPYDYCKFGKGNLIAPLVQFSPNVSVGNYCSFFGNCFVGHDTEIGDFCHIATNAAVGARIKVGKGVHVGINSCIREDITIGDYSIIGMGAVVVKDVPPNTIVVGNPAQEIHY